MATPEIFANSHPQDSRGEPLALLITRGATDQRSRKMDSPIFLIGRHPECDLILGDTQFPDFFAYLRKYADGYQLVQLAEAPLLTVNAIPVERCKVEHGDRIRCGAYEFRVSRVATKSEPAYGYDLPVAPTGLPISSWQITEGDDNQAGQNASRQLVAQIRGLLNPAGAIEKSQHRRSA